MRSRKCYEFRTNQSCAPAAARAYARHVSAVASLAQHYGVTALNRIHMATGSKENETQWTCLYADSFRHRMHRDDRRQNVLRVRRPLTLLRRVVFA